jgi:hypothetical protein
MIKVQEKISINDIKNLPLHSFFWKFERMNNPQIDTKRIITKNRYYKNISRNH